MDANQGLLPGPLPPLEEDRSVYDNDDLVVRELRVTHSNEALYQNVLADVDGAELRVLVKDGALGEGMTADNATLRLRGASSRQAPQKSFRIKLDDNAGLWRGQQVMMLNKHSYEQARVRNKLSFDLFKTIPNFTSLRTSFVHLFINDEDMGLYTQVERPGKSFLRDHGLDEQGQLYKAQDFEFSYIEPEVVANPSRMEEVMDAKANPNHEKLLALIEDVEDETLDINELIEKRFNRENYLTWLAVNAITANFDTNTQNFFLYSPSDRSGWYFLPWDYDDSLGARDQRGEITPPRFAAGVANWAVVPLHRRFFRDPKNVSDLIAKIEEIAANYINDERIGSHLDSYSDIVRGYTTVPPDVLLLPIRSEEDEELTAEESIVEFDAEYAKLRTAASKALADYMAALVRPMPVYLNHPKVIAGGMSFSWDESFDLQGDELTYDLLVGTSPDLRADSLLVERLGMTATSVETSPAFAPGSYFAQVVIRDDDDPINNYQTCSEISSDEYPGVLEFKVN